MPVIRKLTFPPNPSGDVTERIDVEVATEEELLDFANRVREAAEGERIERLLLSNPSAAESCLIATALNFDSIVRPMRSRRWPSGAYKWYMTPPDPEIARAISIRLDLPFEETEDGWSVELPEEIGNAARYFDEGGFPEYNLREIAEKASMRINFRPIDIEIALSATGVTDA